MGSRGNILGMVHKTREWRQVWQRKTSRTCGQNGTPEGRGPQRKRRERLFGSSRKSPMGAKYDRKKTSGRYTVSNEPERRKPRLGDVSRANTKNKKEDLQSK